MIRDFWIGKNLAICPEITFQSSACALFLSTNLTTIAEIQDGYSKFIDAWNLSFKTKHSTDRSVNLEWFLRGIVQGFHKKGKPIETFETIEPYMTSIRFHYSFLPGLKDITEFTLDLNNSEREESDPKERVEQKQKEGFMAIVKRMEDEAHKKQVGMNRSGEVPFSTLSED